MFSCIFNIVILHMRGIKKQNIKQNATLISIIYLINILYHSAPELYVDVTYHVTDCLCYAYVVFFS
jgi:hypothetical protein